MQEKRFKSIDGETLMNTPLEPVRFMADGLLLNQSINNITRRAEGAGVPRETRRFCGVARRHALRRMRNGWYGFAACRGRHALRGTGEGTRATGDGRPYGAPF